MFKALLQRRGVRKLLIPLDQGVYSCATFAANILAARNLPAAQFGVFAFVFTAATLIVGLQRSTFCEPLLILAEEHRERGLLKKYVSLILMIALGAGLAFAVIVAAVIGFSGGFTIATAVLLALFAPFLQDACRFICIAAERPDQTLLSDAICSASQIILMVLVPLAYKPSPELFLGAWALGALAGPILLLPYVFSRLAHGEEKSAFSLGEGWKLGRQFGMDYLLGVATIQGTLLVATAVTGTVATAALRGADTLVGPFRILLASLPAFLLPTWSRREAVEKGLSGQVILFSLPVFALAAVWMAVLLFLPAAYGRMLMGDSWTAIREVLPFILLSLIPITLTTFSAVAIKALRRGREIVLARLALLPIGLALGCGGAFFHGALGAAIGSLVTSVIAAAIWYGVLLKMQNARVAEVS